jgi:glutamate/tyrosine decarboxylase-like PLP-dependent enzyme
MAETGRPHGAETNRVLDLVAGAAARYLERLDGMPVGAVGAGSGLESLDGSLPERGEGASAALEALTETAMAEAVQSSGPRFFHFVIGGVTPAALGADWLASTLDQNVGLWLSSPLGARLEAVTLAWLRDLFGLPSEWSGVLTTGATMANFVGLAAARHSCAERAGVDVEEMGLAHAPPIAVVSSGYIHASAVKALSMLGIGRAAVTRATRDDAGRVDLDECDRVLDAHDGPAIVVANAGEVNAGDFDPIDAMADLAERHGAWLHVDGAFGLFARLSPGSADLLRGVERADSVTADGHKWLNVPFDCGFSFVADRNALARSFSMSAAYFVTGDDDHPDFAFLGPESSRRARALPVWATLKAYGREGHRALVEDHLELARRVGRRVDESDDLERLAEVVLNIVAFRLRPEGVPEDRLDELNRRAGEMVIDDGRVYVGTTTYRGRVAFRPAIVNWRTTERDVDLLVDVVRQLGVEARAQMGL